MTSRESVDHVHNRSDGHPFASAHRVSIKKTGMLALTNKCMNIPRSPISHIHERLQRSFRTLSMLYARPLRSWLCVMRPNMQRIDQWT